MNIFLNDTKSREGCSPNERSVNFTKQLNIRKTVVTKLLAFHLHQTNRDLPMLSFKTVPIIHTPSERITRTFIENGLTKQNFSNFTVSVKDNAVNILLDKYPLSATDCDLLISAIIFLQTIYHNFHRLECESIAGSVCGSEYHSRSAAGGATLQRVL